MSRLGIVFAFLVFLSAPAAASAASITIVAPDELIAGVGADAALRGNGDSLSSRIRFFAVPAPAAEECPGPSSYDGAAGDLAGSGTMTGAGPFDLATAVTITTAGRHRLCAFITATGDFASKVVAADSKLVTVRRALSTITFGAPPPLSAGKASTLTVTAASELVGHQVLAGVVPEAAGCPPTTPEGFYLARPLAGGDALTGVTPITFTIRLPGLKQGRYLVCGFITSGAAGAAAEAVAMPLLLEVGPPPCVVPNDFVRESVRVTYPDAVEAAVRARLAKVGCGLGKVTLREDPATRPQDILSLSPRGIQPAGAPIDVVVSLGRLCRVPNVVGRPLSAARRRFAASGCMLRYVQFVRRRGTPSGRVVEIRQVFVGVIHPSSKAKPLANGTQFRILVSGKPA